MSMKKTLICAAAAAMATIPAAAWSQSLGSNLIVNGNAESGTPGNGGVVAVPGFTTTGEFTLVSYSAGGGYPDNTTPGAAAGGSAFFAGGFAPYSTGSQRIDVSGLATFIDPGTTTFTLSGLLGGYSGQGDNAVLGITFLGAMQNTLGTASIGPVTAGDRGDVTSFLFRSTGGFVPVGTRAIDVLLGLTRTNGSANDGYADNLSLILAGGNAGAVPEPATWAMMTIGLGLAGATLRRRRQRVRTTFQLA